MKQLSSVGFGLLYYNKGLPQFERAFYIALDALRTSGLIKRVDFIEQHGGPVDHSREMVVKQAIERELDAVIWVDTDLIIPRRSFVSLVEMSNAGHPIAAGLYRRAAYKPAEQNILTYLDSAQAATLDELHAAEKDGVTTVGMTAGGFSIVRREVYQAVESNFGTPWYQVFDAEAGDWCFEDTYFIRRTSRLHIPVVVDPDLHAIHWGRYGPVPVTPEAPELEEYCL